MNLPHNDFLEILKQYSSDENSYIAHKDVSIIPKNQWPKNIKYSSGYKLFLYNILISNHLPQHFLTEHKKITKINHLVVLTGNFKISKSRS